LRLPIANFDRARLREEAVQQVGVLGRLHAYREAEILGGLLADLRNGGNRRPGMDQCDVLTFCAQSVGKPVTGGFLPSNSLCAALGKQRANRPLRPDRDWWRKLS
jgi:hypothetical protein